VAQDFYAAFGLGESDRLINTIDIDGINMAGVKALENRTARQQKEIERLNARVESLEQRIQRLEALLNPQAQR
jgi:uncharacterized small protein (DUF1192 family)